MECTVLYFTVLYCNVVVQCPEGQQTEFSSCEFVLGCCSQAVGDAARSCITSHFAQTRFSVPFNKVQLVRCLLATPKCIADKQQYLGYRPAVYKYTCKWTVHGQTATQIYLVQ